MTIEIRRVAYSNYGGEYPRWFVEVSYGGETVKIPLPALHVRGDTEAQDFMEAADGMERLAKELLEFAADLRKRAT